MNSNARTAPREPITRRDARQRSGERDHDQRSTRGCVDSRRLASETER
jgi:hypothetical protein